MTERREWRTERRGAQGAPGAPGPIEVWTIDGSDRRNTLRRTMLRELVEHVERAENDRGLRAVVLTGDGEKAFCAGADLKERAGWSEDDVRAWLVELMNGLRRLERSRKIYIAAVNGLALGGGLELALACDLRVADPRAEMGLPEVTLGIIPGAGGTVRLPRIIGAGRAKEMILTGRRATAGDALGMGLVSRVSAPGRSVDEAVDLALGIADNGPIAVAEAKASLDEGLSLPLADALVAEHRHYDPCLRSQDRLEGLAAFREKRKPSYRGE
jgi:enoyl-CoA hydratase/carnithine racemase